MSIETVGTDDAPGVLDEYTVVEYAGIIALICHRPHGSVGRPHALLRARNLDMDQDGMTVGELARMALVHETEEHS